MSATFEEHNIDNPRKHARETKTEAEHREIGRSEKYQKSSSEYPEEEVPSGRKKNDIYFLCRSKNRWYSVVDVTYLASADPEYIERICGIVQSTTQ